MAINNKKIAYNTYPLRDTLIPIFTIDIKTLVNAEKDVILCRRNNIPDTITEKIKNKE